MFATITHILNDIKLMQQRLMLLKYKRIAGVAALIILCITGTAQNQLENDSLNKNSVYLEIGGNGLWYSFSYDRILQRKERTALSARGGLSYFGNFSDENTITIPLTLSFLYGKNKNFLELGAGPTILHSFADKKPFAEEITGIAAIGIIGFRHQPINSKGIMYRITFNPFIGEYSTDKAYWNWVSIPWG